MARSLLPAALFLALTLPAGAGWWSSGEKSPEDVKQERIKERARSEKLCAKHREFFAKWRAPEIDGDKHYAACFFDYIQNDLYRFDQASWDGLQPVDRCSKLGGARLGDEKKRAHGADRVEDDEKAYVSFEDIREVIQEHCTAWLNARRKLRPEKRSVARREVAGDKIKVADRKDVVAEVTWDGIEAAKRELAGLSGAYIFGRNGATIETLEREIAAAEQKLRSAKGLERAAAMAEQGSLKDAKAAQAAPVEIRTGDEAAGAARSGAMFTGEKSRPGQDPAAKSAPGVPGKAAVGDNTAEPALLSAGAPKTIYEKDLERRVPGLAEGKDRKGLEKLQQKGHDAVFQTKDLPHTDLKQDAALAL